MFLNDLIATVRQTRGKKPPRRQKCAPSRGNRALYDALLASRKFRVFELSVSELAERMGCCVGEASKRVKAAGLLVTTRKDGRRKLVRLNEALSWAEWQDLI